MILLFLISFTLIYIHFGLLVLIQIMIWTLVFFLSNFLITINPSKQYYIIRIMSIFVIIFILYYNTKIGNISTVFIIPLSLTKIDYLDDIIPNKIFISNDSKLNIFYFNDIIEVNKWLKTLEENETYVVTFEFIFSFLNYNDDSPTINLTKPILINNNSNPRLISKFINERIRLACDYYYLDDQIMDMLNKYDGPGVVVKCSKLNLF